MEHHEERADGGKIETGGGASVQGDASAGRDLVGRDSTSATGNVLNVYSQPQSPKRQNTEQAKRRRRNSPRSGGLMPDVERELRTSIDSLNRTIIKLEGTVEKNNAVTIQSIDAFREQLTTLKAQLATSAPTWVAYFVAFCLLIIAVGITVLSVVTIAARF